MGAGLLLPYCLPEAAALERFVISLGLGVGFLHGAAGTGHLFGVVPALALSVPDAATYILAYLFAAVGSMALFGGLLGRIAARGGSTWMRRLMVATGVGAVAIGLGWTWVSWSVA